MSLVSFSTIRQREENHTEFQDEVYEHEARTSPSGDWKPDDPRYVDLVRKTSCKFFSMSAITVLIYQCLLSITGEVGELAPKPTTSSSLKSFPGLSRV